MMLVHTMAKITVRRYQREDYPLWNQWVKQANNATFLFHRDFMEYHSDRFEDFSLILCNEEEWIGVIPAHKTGTVLSSHFGLTYGGVVFKNTLEVQTKQLVFEELFSFLKENLFTHWKIKPIPNLYSKVEDSLDWEIMGFELLKQDVLLAIDYDAYAISKSKLKHFRKRQTLNFEIKEGNLNEFWTKVLIPLLNEKYGVQPIHSLEEIEQLYSKFPQNIKQYNLFCDGEIQAGITIFESEFVVKSQYGAATESGKNMRALDFLFIHLIKEYEAKGMRFFDMGTVMDASFENGINTGLLNQKKELGGKEQLFPTYIKTL